jgi:GDPmannose 4,6-dehydratase
LDWRNYVTLNPGLKRPSDIDISFGYAAKAEKMLGWKAKTQLDGMITQMVEEEMRLQISQ